MEDGMEDFWDGMEWYGRFCLCSSDVCLLLEQFRESTG